MLSKVSKRNKHLHGRERNLLVFRCTRRLSEKPVPGRRKVQKGCTIHNDFSPPIKPIIEEIE
jgi:hypothetical protein